MGTVFKKLGRLLGLRSPSEPAPAGKSESERWADLGAAMTQGIVAGIEQGSARRADLIASGLTPEEAQALLLREVVLDADPAFLAYCEGVVRRSFGTLYEDDKENVA